MLHRLRWQLIITIAGLFLVASSVANLARSQVTNFVPDSGGTYTEGLAGRVQLINPLLWETTAEHDLVSLIFSGLTRTDEYGQIVADLAQGWTIMDEGLTYVFTLREDARWHDGVPVTADDVVYTVGLLQDETADLLPDQALLWRTVTVDKLDPRTVRFSLAEPLAPFLNYTTLPLLPAHRLKSVSAQILAKTSFNQVPVGSGPFRLAEMNKGYVRLTAFEDYYGVKPYLREVIFRLYPELQSLLTAYQNGEIQGISRLLTRELAAASQLPDLTIYSAQQASCVAVILNLDKPLFQDRRVRQALLMALDRQQLIDDYLAGQGIIANSPIFPGSWAYDPQSPITPYDVEGAKAILEEAGWVDSDNDGVRDLDGLRLEFEILTNNDPIREAMANAIARQWAEIDVRVAVQTANIATLREQYLQPRNFDAVLYGWSQTIADPDPYPLWHSSQVEEGQNLAGLENRTIDGLLEAARRTTDMEERRRLYVEFQKIFAEERPALLLYYPTYHYAVDSRVHNVQLPQIIFWPSDRFQTLYRWYVTPEQKAEQTGLSLLLQLLNRQQ